VPQWNGIDEPREVWVEDARGRESEFTLDRNGFALVNVANFYDTDQIKRVYYPEVEKLLRAKLGASRVFVFDHNVRNAGQPNLAPPSRQVHNDHTVNSAPRPRSPGRRGGRAPEAQIWRSQRMAADSRPCARFPASAVRRTVLHG
jgi:hypothetical protein